MQDMAIWTMHDEVPRTSTTSLPGPWLTTVTLIVAAILYWRRAKVWKIVTKFQRVLSRTRKGHHENGIKVVYLPDEADIDIVAVPGLGAHPVHTWSTQRRTLIQMEGKLAHNAPRVNWLQDEEFLQSNFPRARIMIFCYDAGWFYGAPVATLEQRARKLLRDLQRERLGGASSRPLLFIGHSLGGILVKQALCITESNSKFQNILESTLGVIFLGTPHLGSGAASLAVNAVAALTVVPFLGSKATLLKTLCSHTPELSSLRDAFSRLLRTRSSKAKHLKLYSIIETKDTYFLGFIPIGLVVDRDSGTIESGYDPIEVDTDHKGLNKCCSTKDQLYIEIVGNIKDLISSECLKAFASVASNLRQQDPRIGQAVRMTGEEVRSQPAYLAWQASKTSDVLWLVGKMGTGKSTLLKRELQVSQKVNRRPMLQEMLNNTLSSSEQTVDSSDRPIVASYFYSFSKYEVEAQRMLQSLIFQLLYQERRFFPALRNRWQMSRFEDKPVSTWVVDELLHIFHAILNFQCLQRRIELFIDALDESDESQLVLETLKMIPHRNGQQNIVVKVLAASRHSRGITRLPAARQVILEDHNSDEIKKVIQKSISSIQDLLRGNRQIQFLERLQEFEAILTRKARNTILWVSLTLSTVHTDLEDANFSIANMMAALEKIPDDLEKLYSVIVDKFRAPDPIFTKLRIEDVKYRLQWAAYAKRNLTLAEYFHAVALRTFVHPQTGSGSFLNNVIALNTVEDARTALAHCGGFLDVQAVSSDFNHFELHSMGVQLTHGSVLTFLHKPQAEPLRLKDVTCRLEVIDACIAYLDIVLESESHKASNGSYSASRMLPVHEWGSEDYDRFVKYLDEHPLLCYIWSELDVHFESIHNPNLDQRLEQMQRIHHAMTPQSCGSFMLNAWIFHVAQHLQLGVTRSSEKSSFQRWIEAMKDRPGRSSDQSVNHENLQKLFWQQMLAAAVQQDCFATLKTICQTGVLSRYDNLVSLCTEHAVQVKNFGVLDYLGTIQYDRKIGIGEALTRSFHGAVLTACKAGNEDMVNWLLEIGPLWGGRSEDLVSAAEDGLSNAAEMGHLRVAEVLLQHGASPNSRQSNQLPPLQSAAREGHLDIVKLLVKQGADRKSWCDLPTPKNKAEIDRNAAIRQEIWQHDDKTHEYSTHSFPIKLHMLPRQSSREFIGRELVLDALRNELDESCQEDHSARSIALTGLGGIGKTWIAMEFAYRIKSLVNIILWIDAETATRISQSHENAASRIHGYQWDAPDGTIQELRRFYDQVAAVKGHKVIIWDNVKDQTDFVSAFSIASAIEDTFHLVTTRNKRMGDCCTRSIEVLPFTDEESVALLAKDRRIEDPTEIRALEETAYTLGGLPLALSAAASYMRQARISSRRYLQLFEKARDKMLRYEPAPLAKSISQVWDVSLGRLSPRASKLLSFLSVLDPDEIPRFLISHEIVRSDIQFSEFDVVDSLRQLSNTSLISLTASGESDVGSIRMHRLVKHVVLERQYEEELWRNQKLAVRVISELFPSERVFVSPIRDHLMRHALMVLTYDVRDDDGSFAYVQSLSSKVARWLIHTGRLSNARALLEKSLAAQERKGHGPELQLMEIMQDLASVHEKEGRYDEALAYYQKAVDIGSMLLQSHDLQRTFAMNGVADTFARLGRHDEAIEWVREALSLYEQAERGHGDAAAEAKLYSSWAGILMQQGRYEAAEARAWRALEIAGPESPAALGAYARLPSILIRQSKFSEAEDLCLRALSLDRSVLDDMALATLQHAFAEVLKVRGRLEEADDCLRGVLELRKRMLGTSHPDTLASQHLLAGIQADMGQIRRGATNV